MGQVAVTNAPDAIAEIEECDCGGHVHFTLMDGHSAFTRILTAAEAVALGRLLAMAGEAMLAKGAGGGADMRH